MNINFVDVCVYIWEWKLKEKLRKVLKQILKMWKLDEEKFKRLWISFKVERSLIDSLLVSGSTVVFFTATNFDCRGLQVNSQMWCTRLFMQDGHRLSRAAAILMFSLNRSNWKLMRKARNIRNNIEFKTNYEKLRTKKYLSENLFNSEKFFVKYYENLLILWETV